MVKELIVTCALCLLGISCNHFKKSIEPVDYEININHLSTLFDTVSIEGQGRAGIIYIYSEYPDYHWVGDDDEGIACIDDAARACIFFLRNYFYTDNPESKWYAEYLIQFILAMQSENGYFYNFIYADYTINRQGLTSRAEPNWWSWRAFWALSEASQILGDSHPLSSQIETSKHRIIERLVVDFITTEKPNKSVEGLEIPQWLPVNSGADQAALILLGLTIEFGDSMPASIQQLVDRMLDGILKMQVHSNGFPNGVFLSWENIWHAYGNSQAYALLVHYVSSKEISELSNALNELDYFHPEWIQRNGLSNFRMRYLNRQYEVFQMNQFPQIAYDLRPMIWANLQAAKLTGQDDYLRQALAMSQWFLGNNTAAYAMYDSVTGRGFDGINSVDGVNKNAGAESTIEALLALQEIKYYGSEYELPWLKLD